MPDENEKPHGKHLGMKDYSYIAGIVLSMFAGGNANWQSWEQQRAEVDEAREQAREEQNLLNMISAQHAEDVNLQAGINKTEERLDTLQAQLNAERDRFTDWIIQNYQRNGGN